MPPFIDPDEPDEWRANCHKMPAWGELIATKRTGNDVVKRVAQMLVTARHPRPGAHKGGFPAAARASDYLFPLVRVFPQVDWPRLAEANRFTGDPFSRVVLRMCDPRAGGWLLHEINESDWEEHALGLADLVIGVIAPVHLATIALRGPVLNALFPPGTPYAIKSKVKDVVIQNSPGSVGLVDTQRPYRGILGLTATFLFKKENLNLLETHSSAVEAISALHTNAIPEMAAGYAGAALRTLRTFGQTPAVVADDALRDDVRAAIAFLTAAFPGAGDEARGGDTLSQADSLDRDARKDSVGSRYDIIAGDETRSAYVDPRSRAEAAETWAAITAAEEVGQQLSSDAARHDRLVQRAVNWITTTHEEGNPVARQAITLLQTDPALKGDTPFDEYVEDLLGIEGDDEEQLRELATRALEVRELAARATAAALDEIAPTGTPIQDHAEIGGKS